MLYSFLIILICSCIVENHSKFHVYKDGSFRWKINKEIWILSGDIWFNIESKIYSTRTNLLSIQSVKDIYGTDIVGKWVGKMFVMVSSNQYYFELSVKSYLYTEAVIFTQKYLNNTYGTSLNDTNKVISGFPTILIPSKDYKNEIGVYAPKGTFGASEFFANWSKEFELNDGSLIGPLSLFDAHGNTMIISHFTNFMSASFWFDKSTGTFNVGPLGRMDMILKGYSQSCIMFFSERGVNKAFREWGQIMQAYHNSKNKLFSGSDIVNNYLGYWTSHGMCYWYNKETKKTYEETIIDIAEKMKNESIPIKYIELDSWFYPKDSGIHNGGMLDWTFRRDEFPNGYGYIFNKTGLLSASHARYWSAKTPLAKQNGGSFDFIIDKDFALPMDPGVYMHITENSLKWHNKILLQDWLSTQFERIKILQSNISVGDLYMQNINKAAQLRDLRILLCMAYPRHSLSGLTMPSVTMNRVSGDNTPGSPQWKIGINSLWISSLGQMPSKDGFWTNSLMECPQYPNMREIRPNLQSVVSALSAGPTGFGDSIEYETNTTLLMRCCNKDGLILKPSAPATAIDKQFHQRALGNHFGPKGEVWTTHSNISGYVFGVVFAANLENEFKFTPDDIGLYHPNEKLSSFRYDFLKSLSVFKHHEPIILKNCTEKNFCLHYVTPIIKIGRQQVVLLGEYNKWISMSPKRISKIEYQYNSIIITFLGAVKEEIQFAISVNWVITIHSIKLDDTGRKTCTFNVV